MTLRAATSAAHHCSADVVIEAAQTHCHTDMFSQPTVRGNSLKVVQTELVSRSFQQFDLRHQSCPLRLELAPLPQLRWHSGSAVLVQN